MRFLFCFIFALKCVAWVASFLVMTLVYQAVKDIARSSLLRSREADVYPSEELTSFLLDLPHACDGVAGYDAMMVVHSAVTHFQHRQDYRDTYGNENFTHPYTIKLVFFVGLPTDANVQADLTREHLLYGDVIQVNFIDSYHNLSLKAVSVLRWLTERCKDPNIIIKMDDDVLLDVHRFFEEFVPLPAYQNDFMVHCHVWEAAEVERSGKWTLSRRQYNPDTFPDYCSGFFVLMQMPAVEELYYTAVETPVLWIDDVYIYGLVRKLTQDIQVLYLDHVAHSEDIYRNCVQLYGYRCKFWATTMDLSPQTALVPALLSLQADRWRVKGTEAAVAETAAGGQWGPARAQAVRAPPARGKGCAPGACRWRRRREMERQRIGSTRVLSEDL